MNISVGQISFFMKFFSVLSCESLWLLTKGMSEVIQHQLGIEGKSRTLKQKQISGCCPQNPPTLLTFLTGSTDSVSWPTGSPAVLMLEMVTFLLHSQHTVSSPCNPVPGTEFRAW
jgi:hypothetical protein